MSIEKKQENIERLLMSTNREGMDKLLEYMEENGFYHAPCSGAYHLCHEGGLAEHSLNVWHMVAQLKNALAHTLPVNIETSSLIIVSLLHDIGKMGGYGKANYVPNFVRSRTKNKETGEYDMVRSEAKPYITNPDLAYIPHEIRSLNIINKFITLTEEEEFAILYHNGLYGDFRYEINGKETPLYLILHYADLWSARVIEKEANNE